MEDDDRQVIEVGVIVHMRDRDDPMMLLVPVMAPRDTAHYDAATLMEYMENSIWEQMDSQSSPWVSLNNSNGDKTLLLKDHLQSVKILNPEAQDE